MAFVHVQYVDDRGNIWQRKADSLVAAWAGDTVEALYAHPKLPSNIKPRYRLFTEPNGKRLKVIFGSSALTIWNDAVGTVVAGYPNPLNRTGTGGTPGPTISVTAGGTIGEKFYSR